MKPLLLLPPTFPLQNQTLLVSNLTSLLKSCTNPTHLKQTHSKILTLGLNRHPSLLSATTLSYLSFNLIDPALDLFLSIPNPSSFVHNTIIRAFANNGRFNCSLRLYSTLVSSNLQPDKFTFPFALKSCAGLSNLNLGKLVHTHIVCFGCCDDLHVNASLVDMYSKGGDVVLARNVFDRMLERDVVCWSSMITGYAHNGYSTETLEFFGLMRVSNVMSNRASLLSALLACGRLGAIRKGEWFHNYAIRTGFEMDILVATAIVDMYAKCGSLDLARMMFDRVNGKDVVCWSAMITSYGYHGLGNEAIAIFDMMVDAGTNPNHATFTALLSACSHSGLLQEGKKCFSSMKLEFGLDPQLNHYACMVDILGRAGKLNEAQELVEKMPMEPDSSILGSLLGACRIHGDLDLGEKIADKIFELDAAHAGYYVLLSNIYAAKLRWKDVERVRKLMVGRKVSKEQGFSLIEFNGKIFKFGVDDRSHPESKEIYSYLQELTARMKQLGYVPQVELVLHDVEDETKEAALSYHSERLAVAFGLMKLKPEGPIRITKNLRICADCHNAIKIIAKIANRLIIVRDANRFHHFETGDCSCNDYW
ncbi:uncharacterized protein A4U43_C07F5890 [Asparagus officinalis]|uniref:DYW domain-containing protein n=1 Tax=Asparagus officinalis TaxID=4686 RepID=A0A5P1EEY2_ASPOF|nr:pentatricopeptide repeat-containing protein At2g33760-like [Asparagus officinalis]ONK62610.1 uncharacterized protein A4U43_C07F5890 [Asparagus officinalis]